MDKSYSDFDQFTWRNPPPHSVVAEGVLHVTTDMGTDFWRKTYYGFQRDNGHFLHRSVEGDFTIRATVDGDFDALYDQLGLMVSISETHWIKAGIEFTDGKKYCSVVVTNDSSDWSLVEIPFSSDGVQMRLTRHGEAFRVQYFHSGDAEWKPVRLGYLPSTSSMEVGVMCCSPQRSGFRARFKDLHLGEAINRDLHG